MGVLLSERPLARTYSHPSVADSHEIVEQYREAMRYNPDEGSTAIAEQLDVPRGRVRPWLKGRKPDAVHAIETATEHGWLADTWTPVARSLARLVALVYATGAINRRTNRVSWTPSQAVTGDRIKVDLDTVGVGWTTAHNDSERRTTELRPQDSASVIGRALAAADAPVGPHHETVSTLPTWLSTAPPAVRAGFAEWYARERATSYPGKATRRMQVDRPTTFYDAVATLVRDVTDAPVTVSGSGVTISAAAARALGLSPSSG